VHNEERDVTLCGTPLRNALWDSVTYAWTDEAYASPAVTAVTAVTSERAEMALLGERAVRHAPGR